MNKDDIHRLPPPPLFTIRPPPTPPGSLFENFQATKILNGQCVRPSLNIAQFSSSTPVILRQYEQPINWFNLFLLILTIISVICCIIIAIFIFTCFKKLRKEEKQYKNCIMPTSLSTRSHRMNACTGTSEHYKCSLDTFNCCDDYYSHQLISMKDTSTHYTTKPNEVSRYATKENTINDRDVPQNHHYECIPEYILTMTRHHCHQPCCHSHQLYHKPNSICSVPYSTFSRSYLVPQGITTRDNSQCTCSPQTSKTVAQEESSIPLLASAISEESDKLKEKSSSKSIMIGWTRRNSSSTTKQKQHGFLSQLRKSSIL